MFVKVEGGGEQSGDEDGDNTKSATMKELTEAIKGLYMIFLPFIPCFFWSLMIRHAWKKAIVSDDDGKEKKKKE